MKTEEPKLICVLDDDTENDGIGMLVILVEVGTKRYASLKCVVFGDLDKLIASNFFDYELLTDILDASMQYGKLPKILASDVTDLVVVCVNENTLGYVTPKPGDIWPEVSMVGFNSKNYK